MEWVSVEEVHLNPANPRHNDAAVGPVADSLRRFGWQQPIVAKPGGEVVAGNTRLKAARELGMEHVPVVRFEGSELDALAFGIADNRTGEVAEWEDEALRKLLANLAAEDSLEGVGFTPEEVETILAAGAEAPEVEDAPPPAPPEDPVTQPGDLWVMGEHRLLCGDARRPEDIRWVLDGKQADLVWTDPPYGVSYVGKTDDALEIENDELAGEDLERFLEEALGNAAEDTKPGGAWYIAAPAGPNFLPFAKVLDRLGIWRQTLVWLKDVFVLGRSDFHYRHEALFYGWKPGAAHQEPPDRTHDTVWSFDRPKVSREHPTMKPVELVVHALQMSSGRGDLVLDPFLGSGTTVIAAEGTGRRAAGLELDPRYADVIVRRWQEVSGQEAALGETGESFSAVEEGRK